MLIFAGDDKDRVICNPETEPIVILFKNDEERLEMAKHLMDMEPREGFRIYARFPKGYDGQSLIDRIKNVLP